MKIMVLDIGGTMIKSAICENGVLSDIGETPTEALRGKDHLIQNVLSVISEYRKACPFDRIGISTASQVNPVEGSIIYANENMPGYTGTRLKDIVESEFGVPVAVENDVNSAAVGEAFFGAGRGEPDFLCLTYGTGIGGAIVMNGKLFRGSSYSAGEFGAIITHPEDCDPSRDPYLGGYEKYAAASALVHSAQKLDPSITNGRILFSRKEEPPIRALIDSWILEVVYGLATLTHILNPSCIILGGGIMEQPGLVEQIHQALYEMPVPGFRNVTLHRAALGNRAGMLGASILHRI